MSNGQPRDPDDYFADTRMSFGDHIEELRTHLWRAIFGFLVALFGSFFIGKYVMEYITAPVKAQLDRFYDRRLEKVLADRRQELARLTKPAEFRKVYFLRDQFREVARGAEPDPRRPVIQSEEQQTAERAPPTWWERYFLGKADPTKAPPKRGDFEGEERKITESDQDKELVGVWMRVENPLFFAADAIGPIREILQIDSPTTLRAEEAFFVWFKVCLVTGFVIGSPWIFWQVWMFVAAGLYPEEKRLVHFYLPVSLGLFLAGVVICELFVIPKALEALLWFNEWLGFKPDIRLNDWLSFAIWMPIVFGLSFQTPMVMLFLNRIGLMTADSFRGKRSYAWFGMAIFAALITPSVDAFSMLFLWVPMGLLYEAGIFLMRFTTPPGLEGELSESDELIEV
jgi:sec-independent protein translocase protein TatC